MISKCETIRYGEAVVLGRSEGISLPPHHVTLVNYINVSIAMGDFAKCASLAHQLVVDCCRLRARSSESVVNLTMRHGFKGRRDGEADEDANSLESAENDVKHQGYDCEWEEGATLVTRTGTEQIKRGNRISGGIGQIPLSF